MKDGALMDKTLEDLQKEMIVEVKKGFPILLSGAVVFLLFTLMPLVLPIEAVRLSWIFGLGAIFPIGLGISKILGINLNATANPLGTL